MSDIDYGCNESDPAGIIAVILDDAKTAKLIISELNSLGYVIINKTELEKAQQIITRWCAGEYTDTIEEAQDMIAVKQIIDRLVQEQKQKFKCPHCGEVSDTKHDGACGAW